MKKCLFALLGFVFSLAYAEQARPIIPDTPAGKALSSLISAFDSGRRATMAEFIACYSPASLSADDLAMLYRDTGGYSIVRVEQSDDFSLKALLQETDSDNYATLELTVSQQAPYHLLSQNLAPVMPEEFIPKRMPADAAVRALKVQIDKLAKEDKFSGTVLVAQGNKVLLRGAWGQADREAKKPMRTDTQLRFGSMGKMFTAVAILQLVEAGKFQLDTKIGEVLPEYPNKVVAEKVTIRQLLNHTGGMGDIFGPEFDAHRNELKTHADYLRLFGNRAPAFEPGDHFDYSNYGYVLLGAVIEQVSGMSYYDYVQKAIFDRVGMKRTGLLPEDVTVPGRAKGYTTSADLWFPDADEKSDSGKAGTWVANTGMLPYRGTAAGGGYSTVDDMMKFSVALQGGKLLSPQMRDMAIGVQGESIGFVSRPEGKDVFYGHLGGSIGMSGGLQISARRGYVMAVLSNMDPPAAMRVLRYFLTRIPLD